jgi:hypothetical protein
VTILAHCYPELGPVSLEEFARFENAAAACAKSRRAEWKAAFGGDEFPATTEEVHERVILPPCQPGVAQPT